ncbi:MAG: hypothetical protein JOZ03_05610 [Gammaproteobacteria bacterium]|nr:hypothetical protein [Gammaproteobacteria bacterium]
MSRKSPSAWFVPASNGAARCRFVALLALALIAHAGSTFAQFKLQEAFTATSAPGWTLSGNAFLTAPSLDPAGQGWLRLTDTALDERGLALDTGQSFAGNVPVTVRISFVAWGGTGADGITVFLYDATQNMAGAANGGGLGYCNGAGGYLAIGLDEYGNFSNPADHCHLGGPGRIRESLVIRGPLFAGNPYVTGVPVVGGIDNPGVATRPSPKTILVTLTPATTGYTVTALFQDASGNPFQTLFSNVAFPFPAPATLSVGFSGSTGGSTNTHELQGLVTATPDDLQVTMSGPGTVLEGTPVTYTLTVTNNGAYAIGAADAPTLTDALPASLTGVTWTCSPSAGATCTGSGTGNLNTSGLTLPSNAAVTYTVTGMLAPIACGSTLTNTASVDFGSGSTFLDPDPTNNSAAVNSTVSCAVSLLANPGTLSFGPQTVGAPSPAQTITVTGANGVMISNIATTGDYSQSNDCSTPLSGTSCTIQVVFTPGSEGSLNGTVVITSNATSSPTTVALSGTGTNSVPNSFTFPPLNNVDPGSTQTSMPITVSGTNVPTTISVSGGAQYSVNGGPYTSTPGVVPPGAQITVRVIAPSTYGTQTVATVTIGGVSASFTVSTRAQPQLQNVTVTSGGGGGLSWPWVLALAVMLLLRLTRPRALRAAAYGLVAGLIGQSVGAAEPQGSLYFGGAVGAVTSSLTAGKVTDRLQADGYQITASDVQRNGRSGSLYVGYALSSPLALEFGWSYLGHTRTTLSGIAPQNLPQLLADASRVTRGSGDAWSLLARYNWPLSGRASLDLRAGPYRWITHSDLWLGAAEQFSRNDRGWGYVLGVAPRFELSEHVSLGVGARYFASTADNRFFQVTGTIEYRLR